MKNIILPNILTNEVYVSGLSQPLLTVAEQLDNQNKHEYALSLRNAATICDTFAKVNLTNEAVLFNQKESHIDESHLIEMFNIANHADFKKFVEHMEKYRITFF